MAWEWPVPFRVKVTPSGHHSPHTHTYTPPFYHWVATGETHRKEGYLVMHSAQYEMRRLKVLLLLYHVFLENAVT